MTMLSITLPDSLAKASQEAAKQLGVSRTQFIRRAISHELESFQSHLEQKAIVKSMNAMKQSKKYMKEAEKTINEFDSNLSEEGKEWWKS